MPCSGVAPVTKAGGPELVTCAWKRAFHTPETSSAVPAREPRARPIGRVVRRTGVMVMVVMTGSFRGRPPPCSSYAVRTSGRAPDLRSVRTLKTAAANGVTMTGMRSLLIVDDHVGFRSWAREVLAQEGFDVVGEAGDGRT